VIVVDSAFSHFSGLEVEGGTLTIGPSMTLRTGTGSFTLDGWPGAVTHNQGTLATHGRAIGISSRVLNDGTFVVSGGGYIVARLNNLLNYSNGILTGGTWIARDAGSRLYFDAFPGVVPVAEINATVTLLGPGAVAPGLETMTTNLGTFSVLNGATFAMNGSLTNSGTFVTRLNGAVFVKDEIVSTGTFDLSGILVVDYAPGGPSPLAALRAQLASGYNGGGWDGPGINSSFAAINTALAPGIIESADWIAANGKNTIAGRLIDASAVIARLTRYGDADLDLVVNLEDFNRLAVNFGMSSGATWAQGDFTYDGIINLDDFNKLAANFGLSAGPDGPTPDDWSALAAVVPEPGAVGLVALGALTAMAATRRRSTRPSASDLRVRRPRSAAGSFRSARPAG
jgi:hypothetical protein